MSARPRNLPVRLSLIYALVAAVWIILSDAIVALLTDTDDSYLQTIKGIIFILATALLLFAIVRRELRLQQATQQALEESQRMLSTLMSNLPGMAYRCRLDDRWTMEFVSEGSLALTGYRHDQLVGDDAPLYDSFIHPDDRAAVREAIFDAVRADHPFQLTYRIRCANGQEKWVWEQGRQVNIGGRTLLEGFITDITAQQLASTALRESEARYRRLAENAPDIIYRYRLVPDRGFDYISPAVFNTLGYPQEAFYDEPDLFFSLVDEEDRPRLQAMFAGEGLEAGTAGDMLIRVRHRDGRPLWLALRNVSVVSDQFPLVAAEGIARDVTAQMESERALRMSESHLRAIFEGAAIGILRMDPEGCILQTNPALQALLGYSADELHGMTIFDLTHADDLDLTRQRLEALGRGEIDHYGLEKRYVSKDGGLIWCQVTASLVRDAEGMPGLVVAMVEDITECKRVAEALARRNTEIARLYDEINQYAKDLEQRVLARTAELNRAKERVEAILDNTTDIIILLRPNGTIEQANQRFRAAFQLHGDEVIGMELAALVVPEQADNLARAIEAASVHGQSQQLELRVQGQKAAFDAEITLAPVFELPDRVAGIVCHMHDISAHKRIEDHLRQALAREIELNELKSRFVSMVSHEFRTPLAVIQTAVDLLSRYSDRLSAEQRAEEYNRIRAMIRNMVELLDNVLIISRGESGRLVLRPEETDVAALCRDLIGELRRSNPARHALTFTASGDCERVRVDPRLLRQILTNLITNAIKYSPAEGTVTVDVTCDEEATVLTVTDEGIGIPEEDQGRLFEPFHRAENAANIKGTGLGLAIVKQSVDLHRGWIGFSSEEGVGSRFTVRLPQIREDVEPETAR